MRAGTIALSPNGTIEVSVLIAGVPQTLYRSAGRRSGPHAGLFVAGAAGQAYTLQVRNLAPVRVEVINTVDGRNTLKDETGDAALNRGLVFSGYTTGEFTGWRVSKRETRQFIFGSPDRSVAAQATGSAANVGVIGFAAYREREPLHHHAIHYLNSPVNYAGYGPPGGQSVGSTYRGGGSYSSLGASPVATASAGPDLEASTSRGLGTGIGQWQEDRVSSTTFNRTSAEPEILTIGYDTFENLTAMGITWNCNCDREPTAFPATDRTGYESYAA